MAIVALLLICLAISLFLAGAGAFGVRRVLAHPAKPSRGHPGITVLKPLKGVETGLYENLCSMAAQRYPNFEILFGVEDPQDPAVAVVLQVQRENPSVRTRLVTGAPVVGMNPKVNNLLWMARLAQNDLLLISDSNVRVGPDYLDAMASELDDPAVALVHSLLSAEGGDTLGSRVEILQINTVTGYAVAGMEMFTGKPLVIGKSMLFRQSQIAPLGGLLGVVNVLAEDYVLGKKFYEAGLKVKLSPYRIRVVASGWSFERFLNRQLRWSQMRRRLAPTAYFFEPLLSTMVWAVLVVPVALLADLTPLTQAAVLTAAVGGLIARLMLDTAQARRLRGASLSLQELLLFPVKEGLVLGCWLVGGFKRTVDWRGTVVRIGAGSVLTPLEPLPLPASPLEPAPQPQPAATAP